MRILHIMLSCFYVEGLGYQENILPKFHKLEGHEVYILTSIFPNSYLGTDKFKGQSCYMNDDGISVRILERKKRTILGKDFSLNSYKGVYEAIYSIRPDIIFVHGLASLADLDIIKYVKNNSSVILYADQHADYYNYSLKERKHQILNAIVWKPIVRKMVPYTKKIWGTTPWRCTYLHDVYGISTDKIDLLVMGADDTAIDFDHRSNIRKDIRASLGIYDDDFVIISGGKIDKAKNVHLLLEAVVQLNYKNLKVIIFGKIDEEVDAIISHLDNKNIIKIGWIPSNKVYDYYFASDLCVFPGTHSVLWEQACGCGLPGVFKYWEGMRHVDLGGNCVLVDNVSVDSLKRCINDLLTDRYKYERMRETAENKCIPYFSYRNIAKKSIEEIL